MSTSTYNPAKYITTYGPFILKEFADGDSIKVTKNEDTVNYEVGLNGEDTRIMIKDHSAEISLTFMARSPSIDDLQATYDLDQLTNAAAYPFLLKDPYSGTVLFAKSASIVRIPEFSVSKTEIIKYEFMLKTGNIQMRLSSLKEI
jgi:hypothetical protein